MIPSEWAISCSKHIPLSCIMQTPKSTAQFPCSVKENTYNAMREVDASPFSRLGVGCVTRLAIALIKKDNMTIMCPVT